jgi:multiple sugar transport system ATP-binding protein
MNIGTFDIKDGSAVVGAATIPLERSIVDGLTDADQGKVTVGFRPEALDVVGSDAMDAFQVDVNLVEELGSDAFVYGSLRNADADLHSGSSDQVIVRIDPRNVPMKGDTINVTIQPGQAHVFSAATGNRLS